MNKKQQAGQAGTARSPYLSFREALRPAMFAHRLLLEEDERARTQARHEEKHAGRLAEVTSQILTLTRGLLQQVGLGYVASADASAQGRGADGLGYQGPLVDAFADAAMMWSQIVGSCLVLGADLLSQGRLDDVRGIAAALADAGEPATAQELLRRVEDAVLHKYKQRLSGIHGQMKPTAIESALETLTEAVSEIPQSPTRDNWLRTFLPAVAQSMVSQLYTNAENRYYEMFEKNLSMISRGGTHGSLDIDIYQIAAALQATEWQTK